MEATVEAAADTDMGQDSLPPQHAPRLSSLQRRAALSTCLQVCLA